MKKSFVQYFFAAIHGAKTVIWSLFKWGPVKWWKFWILKNKEMQVKVGSNKLYMRCHNFYCKLTDLCMALECIEDKNYTSKKGFEILANDVVIDIGGHIGSFSIYAATKCKKVYCYEPLPTNFNQIKKNIELNNLSNVDINQKAVSKGKGVLKLYVDSLNSAGNSIVSKSNEVVKVESLPLVKIFTSKKISRCNFLKLDCEGAEYEILLSTDIQTLQKIDRIVCEYHVPEFFGIDNKSYTVMNLKKHLENSGFKVTIEKDTSYQGILYAKRT